MRFVPDRPNEIVSAGYDSALIHHDAQQGSFLSRHDISKAYSERLQITLADSESAAPPPSEAGLSLSPPFVLGISLSANGIIAACTADGQIWLGCGGEKRSKVGGTKPKKSRKWEGLKQGQNVSRKIAEGPVVATWV